MLKLTTVIRHRPCHLHSSVMVLDPKSKRLWDIFLAGGLALAVSGDTPKSLLVFLILLPSLLEAKKVAAQLLTSFLNFVRSIIAVSKLSTLRLHFAQRRLGKPSSSFNVISNRALILGASLSWLAFFPNNATLWWLLATEDPQRRHTDAIFASWATWGCLVLKFRHSTRP